MPSMRFRHRTTSIGLFAACLGAAPLSAQELAGPPTPFIHITGADELALKDTGDVTPLRLFIFLHDELAQQRPDEAAGGFIDLPGLADADGPSATQLAAAIHDGYVAWWLPELARLLPGEAIRLTYVSDMPGITDIAQGRADTLRTFAAALETHGRRYGLPIDTTYRNKFILIVPDMLDLVTAGRAYLGGAEAVASVVGPWTVVAHELGHLLGAGHADGEVRATGWWWCQTNMLQVLPIFRHCYAWSAASRRRIQDYYHLGPGQGGAQGYLGADEVTD